MLPPWLTALCSKRNHICLIFLFYVKLAFLQLRLVNDEQLLAMRTGFGNIDEIIISRSTLTSDGMQAIADAIIKREFQVKIKYFVTLCFKLI